MWQLMIEIVPLGAALAMDAFSVSVAHAVARPEMRFQERCDIASCFSAFQFAMPLLGWLMVTRMLRLFASLAPAIPWIACAVLTVIGVGMIRDAVKAKRAGGEEQVTAPPGRWTLLLEGVATSIDALSAGLAFADLSSGQAVLASFTIAYVTALLCMFGLFLGKFIGRRIADRAPILGGAILIAIGLRMLL